MWVNLTILYPYLANIKNSWSCFYKNKFSYPQFIHNYYSNAELSPNI